MQTKEKMSKEEKQVYKAKQKEERKKMRKEKTHGFFKRMRLQTKIIIILSSIIIVGGACFILNAQNKEGQLTTISKSSLQKIIEINELSTVDYTYNATVTQYSEDSQDIKYHVAYEGTVTAGIDFHEIQIDINEDEKKITIVVPEVEIQGVRVDMGTMDYIFTKDKYETETISQEAYKLCKNDLEKRIEQEELLYTTAKENAISSVEALFKPWIETVDSDYIVEIK